MYIYVLHFIPLIVYNRIAIFSIPAAGACILICILFPVSVSKFIKQKNNVVLNGLFKPSEVFWRIVKRKEMKGLERN